MKLFVGSHAWDDFFFGASQNFTEPLGSCSMVQGVNWNFWILGYLGSPELGSKQHCFILPRKPPIKWKLWVSLGSTFSLYLLYMGNTGHYGENLGEQTAGVLSQRKITQIQRKRVVVLEVKNHGDKNEKNEKTLQILDMYETNSSHSSSPLLSWDGKQHLHI